MNRNLKIVFLIIFFLIGAIIYLNYHKERSSYFFTYFLNIKNFFQKNPSLSKKIEIKSKNNSLKIIKENILNDSEIDNFYVSKNKNLLILTSKNKIFIFNRKENIKEEIYEFKNPFEEIILPPFKNIQDILVKTNKEYNLLFLSPSIEKTISLNNFFLRALKNSNFKSLEKDPQILKIAYHPFLEYVYLIKTNLGIYSYNLLNNQIELIYFGSSSNLFVKDEYLYFIKENGIISVYSLKEKKEIKTSFYSFYNQNYSKINLFFNQKIDSNDLIVIDADQNAYYFKDIEDPSPIFVDSGVEKAFLNGNNIFVILKNNKEKNFLVKSFNPENKTSSFLDLPIDSSLIDFINQNYFVFLKDKKINLFSLLENKPQTIADDLIKNNNFFFDPSLNYLYYLTQTGLQRLILNF